MEHFLQKLQCLGHVFIKSAEGNADVSLANIDGIAASELIEGLLDLRNRHVAGDDVVQIVGCIAIAIVGR